MTPQSETQPVTQPKQGNQSMPSKGQTAYNQNNYKQNKGYYAPQQWQSMPQSNTYSSCSGVRQPQGQTSYNPQNYYSQSTGTFKDSRSSESSKNTLDTMSNQKTSTNVKQDAYTKWETAEVNNRASNMYRSSPVASMESVSTPAAPVTKPAVQTTTPPALKVETQPLVSDTTESSLVPQLNAQGKATYQNLDNAGKALAIKMANQGCKGQNDCKGLNACKTFSHSCAGQGTCKGTSTAAFKDKNLAVKVAAMKMAEKRANATLMQ